MPTGPFPNGGRRFGSFGQRLSQRANPKSPGHRNGTSLGASRGAGNGTGGAAANVTAATGGGGLLRLLRTAHVGLLAWASAERTPRASRDPLLSPDGHSSKKCVPPNIVQTNRPPCRTVRFLVGGGVLLVL